MNKALAVLGDVESFYERQLDRLMELGIEADPMRVSHVAFRTLTYAEYLQVRGRLEALAVANVENVWNGRPISKILLREPIRLGGVHKLELIELIPPIHQRVYRMGLEHLGLVVDGDFDAFGNEFKAVLSGQQFQTIDCDPYYVRFEEDYTHVKFYRESLREACEREGRSFSGFEHVENWGHA